MEKEPGICEYEHWYHDTRTGKYEDYSCNRASVPSSQFCEFHDDQYFKTHEDEVRNTFLDELSEKTPGGIFGVVSIEETIEGGEFDRARDENIVDESLPIFFIGCNIPSVDVSNIHQNRPVYFVSAKFNGDMEFFDIQFSSVNFSHAKFSGKLRFTNVNASKFFLFTNVRFLNINNSDVKFEYCDLKTARFSLTTFHSLSFQTCTFNYANFRTTDFNDNLSIAKCSFIGEADFSDCYFRSESKFELTSFHTNTIFQYAHFLNVVKYHNVDFKEQKLTSFNGDLSNVSFLGTDITRVKFDEKTIWGNPDRYSIFDARELIDNPEQFGLASVLAVYRNLRENYEFRLMYEEAGQFFVKEMELKRIYYEDANDNYNTKIKEWRRYFSLTNCYNILCQYGESFKRVSIWALVIFFSASIYFFIFPDINELEKTQPLGDIDYSSKVVNDIVFRLEITLERTLASFFQVSNNDLADYLVRISALPVLGTLFVVLRRRFERRFRH